MDGQAEHLVAAADPHDRPATRRGRGDRLGQPGVAKPGEILRGVLASGQNDQVGVRNLLGVAHESNAHAGLTRQRLEVVEVGDPWQPCHRHLQRGGAARALEVLEVQRILGGHERLGDEGHDAEHRHAGPGGQLVESRRQKRRVPTELVDDEAGDPRSILRRQQRQRADEGREDAAAIDITDEEHGRVGHARDPHVDDLAFAQVDLGRTAGSLDDHDVVRAAQSLEALPHEVEQPGFHRGVLAERGAGHGASPHHDLRPVVRLGLQQDRVHVDGGLDARGLRLRRLGPADLAAIDRDRRVQRHVLRLERRHAIPRAGEEAAEGRGQNRLADGRPGALDHETRRQPVHTVPPGDECRGLLEPSIDANSGPRGPSGP